MEGRNKLAKWVILVGILGLTTLGTSLTVVNAQDGGLPVTDSVSEETLQGETQTDEPLASEPVSEVLDEGIPDNLPQVLAMGQVTITYDANGGTTPSFTTTVVNVNGYVGNMPNTSREHYQHWGWYTQPKGGVQVFNHTQVAGDVTYYANWVPINYTAAFNSLGGTQANPSHMTRNVEQELGVLPVVTREGYTFMGWFTEQVGGVKITPQTKITTNIHYSARWGKVEVKVEGAKQTVTSGKPATTKLNLKTSSLGFTAESLRLVYSYDEDIIDESAVTVVESTQVKEWEAADGELEITLNPINQGEDINISIDWNFKPFTTPGNTTYPVTLALYDGEELISDDIEGSTVELMTTYPAPTLTIKANGIAGEGGLTSVGDTVMFEFTTSNLQRNLSGYSIKVDLPTYKDNKGDDQVVVFDPLQNTGWVLSEDGQYIEYREEGLNTHELEPTRLVLTYNGVRSGESFNLKTSVQYTPYNQAEEELLLEVEDTTGIEFFAKIEFMPATGTLGLLVPLGIATLLVTSIVVIQRKKTK